MLKETCFVYIDVAIDILIQCKIPIGTGKEYSFCLPENRFNELTEQCKLDNSLNQHSIVYGGYKFLIKNYSKL